ncbi:MAG: alpha/beta hydrolase [Pseudomonadota bacterium]
MPSREHEQIVTMLAANASAETLPIEQQRLNMEAVSEMFPLPDDVQVDAVVCNEVVADWISLADSDLSRVVMYLHGGAYTKGSRQTHRELASRIARASGACVLLPEYRLAPEHPCPAGIDDAMACWQWLIAEGYRLDQLAIAGDSAGAGLALALLQTAKAQGIPRPARAALIAPWVDLELAGPSAQAGIVDDPMLQRDRLLADAQHYAGDDLRRWQASPLYGDLSDLPPMLVQVGGRDLLVSDSTRLAKQAQSSGSDVTLEVEDGLVHVWHFFPMLPESQSAIARLGAFLSDL